MIVTAVIQAIERYRALVPKEKEDLGRNYNLVPLAMLPAILCYMASYKVPSMIWCLFSSPIMTMPFRDPPDTPS